MQTITLQYNPENKFANALIQMIRACRDVKIIEKDEQYSPATRKAFRNIEEGKTTRVSNVDELFKQILD